MAEQNTPIQEILDMMNAANDAVDHQVYCPSIGKPVPFREMSTKNHKAIVNTFVGSPFLSLSYDVTFAEIIKSCCKTPEIMPDLRANDKACITLAFRAWNKDEVYTFEDTDYGTHDISINTILSKADKIKFPKEKVVNVEGYEITIDYPTIQREYEYDQFTLANSKKYEGEEDPKKLKPLVATIYIITALKYISAIKVGGVDMDFAKRPIPAQITIGESLTAKVINTVIGEVDRTFNAAVEKVTQVKFKKDKKEYTETIPLDSSLFV